MRLPDGAEGHRGALAIKAVPVRLSIFNVKLAAFEERFLVHGNRALKAFCFIPVLMNFFPFDVHLEFNRDKTRTMVGLWKREKGAGRAQYRVLSAVSPMPLSWQAAASAAVREDWGDSPGALDSGRLLPQRQLNLSSRQRSGHSRVPAGSVPLRGILSKVLLRPRRVTANLSMRRYGSRMSPSSLTTHQHPASASPTSHVCL